jgi:hypothetical protein
MISLLKKKLKLEKKINGQKIIIEKFNIKNSFLNISI